ncbi:hypothetical protein [Paenibacillus kobensis]|uniref:hypothetical protein n=1 Tax=Paenibacillus kobensis TaxID=59841 RepID=UPI000FD85A28|nr:hypothetical protein [Paenibacillus kobensis]
MKWFKKLGLTISMVALTSGVFAAAASAYDNWESNDTLATATQMPTYYQTDPWGGQYAVFESTSYISTPTDVDYYKLIPFASSQIRLTSALGMDYDFEVYDQNGTLIATSTSTSQVEKVTFTTAAVRYVKVYGKNGQYNSDRKKPYVLHVA